MSWDPPSVKPLQILLHPGSPLVKTQLQLILLKPSGYFQPEDVSRTPRLSVRRPAPRGWGHLGKQHESQSPGNRLKKHRCFSSPFGIHLDKELVNKRGNPRWTLLSGVQIPSIQCGLFHFPVELSQTVNLSTSIYQYNTVKIHFKHISSG